MPNSSPFSFVRRCLFPYSGELPLTPGQALRVVLTWMLLFSLPMTVCVLILTLMEGFGTARVISSAIFAFLSGAFIFGMLSVLIVIMSNRAAQIRQAWKAQNGRS